MFKLLKIHPILKIVNGSLVELPSPTSLSKMWNFGSLLGLCLSVQLLSGVFLAMQFIGDTSLSFYSVSYFSQDSLLGNTIRAFHANGASFFFMCLYLHSGRGLYYGSYVFYSTWSVGVVIMLLVMAAAFLGYVLPWGQMSFWGASVITGLPSDLPFVGPDIVITLWGGLSVGGPTLTRFFTFHFLVPFVIAALAMVHLLFLHQTGSNNPLGLSSNSDKMLFQPYFSYKDLLGVLGLLMIMSMLVFMYPWLLGDPENFITANPLVTPIHIQPEWYFLFAYAILRSIPNKLGGVVALAMAILILLITTLYPNKKFRSTCFYPLSQFYFWLFTNCVILLTWIGARPVEAPYIATGQILTLFYFSFYFLFPLAFSTWDKTLN